MHVQSDTTVLSMYTSMCTGEPALLIYASLFLAPLVLAMAGSLACARPRTGRPVLVVAFAGLWALGILLLYLSSCRVYDRNCGYGPQTDLPAPTQSYRPRSCPPCLPFAQCRSEGVQA